MKRLYTLLLIIFAVQATAQHINREVILRPVEKLSVIGSRALEAQFTSDVTSGAVPLTVHFTDQSTGNPTSWNWDFGDGTSDTLQNPVHTYNQVGTYTVKLTISDGIQFYALEKKNYITVSVSYNGCDTLHFPLPEPLTYYVLLKNNVSTGYVSGNNAYGDKAIADFFDNTSPDMAIKGAIFEFSYTKLANFNSETLLVKAWKYDSISKAPGNVIGSVSVSLADIASDVAALRPTQVVFDEPLPISGPFFLGIYLPEQTGDTLVLWTTKTGVIVPNTGWVLQSNNSWAPYDSLYTNPVTLVLTNAIYPIICHTSNGVDDRPSVKGFTISPNPASDYIRIESGNPASKGSRYDLITATGEKVMSGILNSLPGSEFLNVSSCKPGLYFLRISNPSGTFVRRLVIK
jgi:PKD repeat protein